MGFFVEPYLKLIGSIFKKTMSSSENITQVNMKRREYENIYMYMQDFGLLVISKLRH